MAPAAPSAPRRSRRYLVAAALLLALAALLLSAGAGEPAATERVPVEFPIAMRPAEVERMQRRATLPAPPPTGEPVEPGAPPAEPSFRDPFLAALPVEPGQPVLVFEANALRHSRLGELFVECLLAREPDALAELERAAGIDPLKDIDRVGFAGDAVVVSGYFDRLKLDELEPDHLRERYGDAGTLLLPDPARARPVGPDGLPLPDDRTSIALWKDQLLVFADDPASLRLAIDQLEGRAPAADTGLTDDLAYGEVYGVIPGEAARRLFGRDARGLGERLAAAASRIELHVDAQRDLAAMVRVRGEDAAGLSDLARSLGAALAVARVEANATDDARFAELLESARVTDRGGTLAIELAVPVERLEEWFRGCGNAGAPGTEAP